MHVRVCETNWHIGIATLITHTHTPHKQPHTSEGIMPSKWGAALFVSACLCTGKPRRVPSCSAGSRWRPRGGENSPSMHWYVQRHKYVVFDLWEQRSLEKAQNDKESLLCRTAVCHPYQSQNSEIMMSSVMVEGPPMMCFANIRPAFLHPSPHVMNHKEPGLSVSLRVRRVFMLSCHK